MQFILCHYIFAVLEKDGLITRKQYSTIPPTVEYSLAPKGQSLIPALESIYQWADKHMK